MEVSIMKRILRSPFLLVGMLALLLALAAASLHGHLLSEAPRHERTF